MIGQVFGSYRITERITAGGMGVVYRAVHVTSGEKAAMKHLLPQFAGDPEMIARFLQEARTAAAIADPGIVRVYDAGLVASGGAYLVMELLAGETLRARLQREGALAPGIAVPIMRQVCRTVGVAHLARIVHRDLKPDNIFLVPDPDIPVGVRAKVLDFGIAKLLGDAPGVHTMTGCSMGTPAYMAPELWANAKNSDERTDIYALGCIAFEVLTGKLSFPGPSLGAFLDQHRHEPPPRLVGGLAPLQPVIDRALAKAPADRWPTTEALSAALSAADPALAVTRPLEPAGRVEEAPRPREPEPREPRRNPAKLVLFGGAAVGLLVIVSSVVLRMRRENQEPGPAPEIPERCDRVITLARQVPSVLPVAYVDQVRSIPGVMAATFGRWLSPDAAAVDSATYLAIYPEIVATKPAVSRWRANPPGALVEARFAEARGLTADRRHQLGTLETTIIDTFTAAGPTPRMLLHWRFANESRAPDETTDTASWIATRVAPSEAARVALMIDRGFENSARRTSSFVDPSCKQLGKPKTLAKCEGRECLPDVTYIDTNGNAYTPQSLANKVVVVNFWATWCKPCLKEIPILSRMSETYASRGVVFLGILNDTVDNASLLNFQSDNEMTHPTVRATSEIMGAYGNPDKLPTTFVFDRNGNRTHSHVGAMSSSQLATILEPLANAGAPRTVHEIRAGGARATASDDGTLAVQLKGAPDLGPLIVGIERDNRPAWQLQTRGERSVDLVMSNADLEVRVSLTLDTSLVLKLDVASRSAAPTRTMQLALPPAPAGWYLACAATTDGLAVTLSRSAGDLSCPRDVDIGVALAPGERKMFQIEIRAAL